MFGAPTGLARAAAETSNHVVAARCRAWSKRAATARAERARRYSSAHAGNQRLSVRAPPTIVLTHPLPEYKSGTQGRFRGCRCRRRGATVRRSLVEAGLQPRGGELRGGCETAREGVGGSLTARFPELLFGGTQLLSDPALSNTTTPFLLTPKVFLCTQARRAPRRPPSPPPPPSSRSPSCSWRPPRTVRHARARALRVAVHSFFDSSPSTFLFLFYACVFCWWWWWCPLTCAGLAYTSQQSPSLRPTPPLPRSPPRRSMGVAEDGRQGGRLLIGLRGPLRGPRTNPNPHRPGP